MRWSYRVELCANGCLLLLQTLFGEGCRGSCSEEVMEKFNLREGVQPQTYGIGVKEVWRIPKEKHQAGLVQHTLGWPLQRSLMDKTFGGSFMYHMEDDLVQIGVVVGLDYENPYINPYEEFQRFKTHPAIRKYLEGGECVQYGARCLNEGGYHAIPKLTFPGGGLIGCSAGFLNGVKIKGTHTAMKSGMLAAEAAYEALTATGAEPVAETAEINPEEPAIDISSYEGAVESSWIAEELKAVRNVHAGFHKGFLPGLLHAGVATHVLRGKEPWTIPNTVADSAKTRPAKEFTPIDYPKPDGKLTFDLLSNLQRSGTNHNHDQPAHLRIKPELAEVPQRSRSRVRWPGAAVLPCPRLRVHGWQRGQRRPAACDQRSELRPLQVLLHQNAEGVHQVDRARRRRWPCLVSFSLLLLCCMAPSTLTNFTPFVSSCACAASSCKDLFESTLVIHSRPGL